MNVSDIANGSEVKIHASISGHGIVILTEAIFGVSEGLLVKPMEYFGKYMQFLEPSNVSIRNKRDGRVYRFMSTTITPVRTRYGNFHIIRSSSKLEPENIRKAERFYIEKLGLMSINGNNMDLKNCIVYDISMRGIALIPDRHTSLKVGDTLDVMFRYDNTLHNYEVSTVVVRTFKIDGKNAVGCSISNINVDLIGLLASKKKEQTELDRIPETNLNPAISEKQQIKEVNEDIANDSYLDMDLIPERPSMIRIENTPVKAQAPVSAVSPNPLDPSNLEHVSRDSSAPKKSIRERRLAQEDKKIADLLDLKGLD
ncbi:MAG: PilZ domain-containing protein [Butyrivibrio sp.]|nr:PilZ domain-containing protein [Butyrivibrio sp.]